jgi:hypothetical protein
MTENQQMRALMKKLMSMMDAATQMTSLERVFAGARNIGADVPMPVYDKADFKELDKIMQEVNFTSMPTVLIITYLRTTCSVSEYLDHWKDAVQRAKAELESRQEDWERILRGLL